MNTIETDAYAIAEEEAARALAAALGFALGRDLFIGHAESTPICATFQFDECPRDLGAQFAVTRQLRAIAINASLRITAAKRSHLTRAIASLLFNYPFEHVKGEVLDTLRIREDGLGAITTTIITDNANGYGAGQTRLAYTTEIGFLASFHIR